LTEKRKEENPPGWMVKKPDFTPAFLLQQLASEAL
jgi:hypothetical protein